MRIIAFCFLLIFTTSSCENFAREKSNEVLEAFSEINSKLDSVNQNQIQLNDSLMFKVNSFSEYYNSIKRWDSVIKVFDDQLTVLKESILENGINTPEQMQTSTFIDNTFFANSSLTPEGNRFVSNVDNVSLVFGREFGTQFPELNLKVKEEFNTNMINGSPWLNYHFEDFPVIVSLTKFTQMQQDLKYIKQELLSSILSK